MGCMGRGGTVGTYPVYVRHATISDIHKECPYAPPQIRFVDIDIGDDLLQGVIETSGEPGPHVDPDHPADPDDPDLVSHGSVWEIEG